MGCTASKGEIIPTLGPKEFDALKGEKEIEIPDEDLELNREWPYVDGRLKEHNYKAIIKEDMPWTDPDFKPDATSLFLNGKAHKDAETLELKAKWNKYTWMRASELFKD